MRLTKIRIRDHEDKDQIRKAGSGELIGLCDEIINHMNSLGFICDAEVLNSSSVKVGINQRQFNVDIQKLGYNTQHSSGGNRKRTCLPSWNQRVEFNDALNAILDRFGFSANVSSGPFTVRKGEEVFTEEDWENQIPSYLRQNIANGYFVEQGDYKAPTLKRVGAK